MSERCTMLKLQSHPHKDTVAFSLGYLLLLKTIVPLIFHSYFHIILILLLHFLFFPAE